MLAVTRKILLQNLAVVGRCLLPQMSKIVLSHQQGIVYVLHEQSHATDRQRKNHPEKDRRDVGIRQEIEGVQGLVIVLLKGGVAVAHEIVNQLHVASRQDVDVLVRYQDRNEPAHELTDEPQCENPNPNRNLQLRGQKDLRPQNQVTPHSTATTMMDQRN